MPLDVSACPHEGCHGSIPTLKIHGETSLPLSQNKKLLIALQMTWQCTPHLWAEKNPAALTARCLFLFWDTPESTGQSSQLLLFTSKFAFCCSVLTELITDPIFQTAWVEEFCCIVPLDRAFMVNLQKSLTFSPVLILNNIFSLSTAVFNCCSQNRTTKILTRSQKNGHCSSSYFSI